MPNLGAPLLYHESDLLIDEHYTDTAGFTDHVFGLFPFEGSVFAPRIADLPDYVWHANKRVAHGRFRPLRSIKPGTPRS